MKKYLVLCAALSCAVVSAAIPSNANDWNNTFLRFLYFDDLKTWVSGGKSLFNWSQLSNRKHFLSKEVYAPHAMYHEFDGNVYAASNKYNSLPIQLNGVVHSVKANRDGEPIVTFVAGYNDQFEAFGLDVEDVAKLKRGQPYRFVCYQFDYDGIALRSKNCKSTEKFYDLISLGIFNNIETEALEALTRSDIVDSKVMEVFIKNIPQEKLKNFHETCHRTRVDDANCREQMSSILYSLESPNKKAP